MRRGCESPPAPAGTKAESDSVLWSGRCWEQDCSSCALLSTRGPEQSAQRGRTLTPASSHHNVFSVPAASALRSHHQGRSCQGAQKRETDPWHVPYAEQDRTRPSAAKHKPLLQRPTVVASSYLSPATLPHNVPTLQSMKQRKETINSKSDYI